MDPRSVSAHDRSRAHYLLSVIWVQCSISIVLVALRCFCRIRVTRNFWWDDWCILITLLFAILASAAITAFASFGNTHPQSLAQASSALMWNFISLDFGVMAIATGKVSVAFLIYRLQSPSPWRTWLLWFLAVSSLVVGILIVALEHAQCTPSKKLWTPSVEGSCWDLKRMNDWDVAGSCYWVLEDLALALLPITFLWNLQLSIKRRMTLCALLGLGIFAAVCGAVKASYVPTQLSETAVSDNTVALLVWNMAEANVIIYGASLPTIRPLFRRLLGIVSNPQHTAESTPFPSRTRRRINTDDHIQLESAISNSSWKGKANTLDRDDDSDAYGDGANVVPPGRIARSFQIDVSSRKASLPRQDESEVNKWNPGQTWAKRSV